MTVLVGVLCSDGVVVGSDSSATISTGNFNTIEQSVEKTFVYKDVVVAGTGQVGLGQRFLSIVRAVRDHHTWNKLDHIAVGKSLCAAMIKDMRETGLNPGLFGSLVAFACGGRFQLCEFALNDFQPEFKDADRVWFASMGSGQPISDPFFGLLGRTIFRDRPLRLKEGQFAVHSALSHAIHLNCGGINGPAQIATIQMNAAKPEAKLLTQNELEEHADGWIAFENYMREYRDRMTTPSRDIPPAPTPP